MPNRKPSKTITVLYAFAALGAAFSAVADFVTGRELYGWIWCGAALIWCGATFFAARTYHWRMLSYRRVEQMHADFARRGWTVRDASE